MNTAPASNITEPFICLHHDSYTSSLLRANLKDEYQKHDVSIFLFTSCIKLRPAGPSLVLHSHVSALSYAT